MGNLLTIDEMCAKLKICRKTWERWKNAKKIPYIVLPGNVIRFDPDDLQGWVMKRKVKAKIANTTA